MKMPKVRERFLLGAFLLLASVAASISGFETAKDPTFLYLGTIVEDCHERIAVQLLEGAGADVLRTQQGMILFRLTSNTKSTGILGALPFLHDIYTDARAVLEISRFKDRVIVSEFAQRTREARALGHGAKKAAWATTLSPASESSKTMLEMDALIRTRAASMIRTHAAAASDDPYEPNDTFLTAVEVVPGQYDGLQSQDDDWYKIDLAIRRDLIVRLDHSYAAGDLSLEIYRSDGVLLNASAYGGHQGGDVQLAKLPPGYYFLRVPHSAGTAIPYSMTIRRGALLGSISGRVTSEATGAGLKGIRVEALRFGHYDDWRTENFTYSGDSGYYSIAVEAGYFCLYFDGNIADDHLWEFYDNKSDLEESDWIHVVGTSDTPGINAALARGGRITGRVTSEATGAGIGGIRVSAVPIPYGDYAVHGTTDGDGYYVLPAVRAGNVKASAEVAVETDNYLTEWFDQKSGSAAADLVPVTAGTATSNIDFSLATGGIISGRVTDSLSGAGVGNIPIAVSAGAFGEALSRTSTDDNGDYSALRLPTGSWTVEFNGYSDTPYLTEWYDGQWRIKDATPVPVTAGQTTSGVDVQLDKEGIVSGRVTDVFGNLLGGVHVHAYRDADGTDAGYAFCGIEGDGPNYSLNGLRAGAYRIKFEAQFDLSNLHSEWYPNKPGYEEAAPVTVAVGQTVSGIDAQLEGAGHLRVVVRDPAGEPVCSTRVEVYGLGGNLVEDDSTFIDGTRSFYLKPGSYKVKFDPSGAGPLPLLPEWYDNRSDFATAETLAVAADTESASMSPWRWKSRFLSHLPGRVRPGTPARPRGSPGSGTRPGAPTLRSCCTRASRS